jgi:hypothetical protein
VFATPNAPVAPNAPTALTAVAGNQQITLSWTAPANNGSTITKYTVYDSSDTFVKDITDGTSTSTIISGLTRGTLYSYYIKAYNTAGYGPASFPASATPYAPPPYAISGLTTGVNSNVDTVAYDTTYVYIGGSFTAINGVTFNRIARFNKSDGILDMNWKPNVSNGAVNSIAVNSTHVYIGGFFTEIGVQTRNHIARIPLTSNPTGAFDSTWNLNLNGAVNSIAVNSTHVYIGGQFTSIGGQPRNYIARIPLTSDIGEADSWNLNLNGVSVTTIALDNSNVYVGGNFTSIGGQQRNNIARIPLTSNPTGNADTWAPNANGTVWSIAVNDTHVYVGGNFTEIGGQLRNRIARIPLSSTTVDAWNPDFPNSGFVSSIAVNSEHVYIGGNFTSIGGQPRNNIARIPLTSSTVDAWNPNANRSVMSIALDNSNVYIGGVFNTINTNGSVDLYNSKYFTMNNLFLSSSSSILTNIGVSNLTPITSKVINQDDIVTDNFIDFSTITAPNKSAVRHALLTLLQETRNSNTTKFYMPKTNIGLSGTGNVCVYRPFQQVVVSTVSNTAPAYVNLYNTGDYVDIVNEGTTKRIIKTVSGYLLDGVTYVDNNTITVFTNYTITFGGVLLSVVPSTLAPTPIEVNLNVEVSANGEIQILSETAPVVTNFVNASVKLPVDCLYDATNSKGLIEFWEPDNIDDIVCQLAQSPNFGASGYQETAAKLVVGLQAVLCGSLDASAAQPFNASSYNTLVPGVNGNRVMTGFGSLALMAYAHYLLGHVQATAAITNDKEFIRAMLSLKSTTADVTTILPSDYRYDVVPSYASDVAPYSDTGNRTNANLAARLVNKIITTNSGSSLVSLVNNSSLGSVASIVKQVLGQDANRAVNVDNSKYSPERHGLLKFFKDDVIYVTITLIKPSVVISNNQKVSGTTIQDRYPSDSSNAIKYTLRIVLE